MERRTREEFLSNLQLGNIVAFRVGDYMYSGKVVSIVDNKINYEAHYAKICKNRYNKFKVFY